MDWINRHGVITVVMTIMWLLWQWKVMTLMKNCVGRGKVSQILVEIHVCLSCNKTTKGENTERQTEVLTMFEI